MPNDMSGTFIAFDEASKLDWKKLTVLPMPSDHKADLFYFPKTGKIGKLPKSKYEEMTFTTEVVLSQVAPKSVDAQEIYKAMRALMEHRQEILYYRQHEERTPKQKAYEILKTPDNWVQKSVREHRMHGIAYCILGALIAKWGIKDMTYPNHGFIQDVRKVASLIRRNYSGSFPMHIDDKSVIAYWNDYPGRKFDEVQNILKLADV